eukprot:CAMPEP_0179089480 /NCGR_PEP_ID=MMETSP0796-20121207/40774_1 /TAXON_ID=73915 /ORGANISM="Pyrodinium bahamense, Strain pbaha01" /LENGTH=454 /DNA_ID=CAMNT_0020787037 /DNA_START=51 /DNA_END=1417 /DNA_ORIENTATION=-
MRGPQPYAHLFEDEEEASPESSRQGEVCSQDLELLLSEAKSTGNNLFQEGRYDDASAAYKRGLDAFEGSRDRSSKRAEDAEVQGHRALLQLGAEPAAGHRAQALLREPVPGDGGAGTGTGAAERQSAVQAGLAHAFAEDWALAVKDFDRVLELEPGSDAARRELEKARERRHGPGPSPAAGRASSMFNTDEKLESVIADAEDDKAKGSRLFMDGNYYEAYEAWQQGISALADFPSDALTVEARRLLVALCNNSAQALLQCPEVPGASTELAAAMAGRALGIEPSNIKALFRRGCAYANGEQWRLARRDFEHVLEVEPGNAAAQEQLEKIRGLGPSAESRADGAQDFTDPDVVSKMAQKEAERFRREILAVADGNRSVAKWCQRFNKTQVQAAAWAKHQLADTEGLQDLITLRGQVFLAMSEQQREDFITACEFMSEMRAQYGDEIDDLLASAHR